MLDVLAVPLTRNYDEARDGWLVVTSEVQAGTGVKFLVLQLSDEEVLVARKTRRRDADAMLMNQIAFLEGAKDISCGETVVLTVPPPTSTSQQRIESWVQRHLLPRLEVRLAVQG